MFYNTYCNLIAQIKKGIKQNLKLVYIKYNKFTINLLYFLYKYGLIFNFKIIKTNKNINKQCLVCFKYKNNINVINDIYLYSKPSNNFFIKKKLLVSKYLMKDKNAIFFISTPFGLKAYNYYDLKYVKGFFGGILLFKVRKW